MRPRSGGWTGCSVAGSTIDEAHQAGAPGMGLLEPLPGLVMPVPKRSLLRPWLAGAAGLLAIGAGATGSALAQGDVRPRWEVIPDQPDWRVMRPAPSQARRQIASEAAALASEILVLPHAQRNRPRDLSAFPDHVHFLPYVSHEDVLDLNGGPAVFTALHLAAAGYPDAVRQLEQALRDQPDGRFPGARVAISILLGHPPPPLDPDGDGMLVVLVRLSLLDQSALRGDHGALRANLLQVYTEFHRALVQAFPDSPIGLRTPEQFTADHFLEILNGLGKLSVASETVQREGLLKSCEPSGSAAVGVVEQLAMAGRWAEASALLAGADRTCLPPLLTGFIFDAFVRAGQGPLLDSAIRTALEAPPSEPSIRHKASELIGLLAARGYADLAEREIALQRAAGNSLLPSIEGVLAATALVSGERDKVIRYWGALDQMTNGDLDQIAAVVAVVGLSADPEGPWRERAVAWLGLDQETLDRQIARHIDMLDPGRVADSPTMAALTRHYLDMDISPEMVRDHPLPLLPTAFSRLEMRLAAGEEAEVLEEIRSGHEHSAEDLAAAAMIAADFYGDAALFGRLQDLAGEMATRSSKPDHDRSSRNAHSGAGLCMVPVLGLHVPEHRRKALEMLLDADLFADDRLVDHCRAAAAYQLALLGSFDDAVRAARAVANPAFRAVALASTLAAPLPPEAREWERRMKLNGAPAYRPMPVQ